MPPEPTVAAADALRASPPRGARHGRAYDLILVGATGYTGRLVARYLAERARDLTLR